MVRNVWNITLKFKGNEREDEENRQDPVEGDMEKAVRVEGRQLRGKGGTRKKKDAGNIGKGKEYKNRLPPSRILG